MIWSKIINNLIIFHVWILYFYIRVLDLDGGSQYYQGGYNSKGECHGKGIWIRDYDIYIGNFRKLFE